MSTASVPRPVASGPAASDPDRTGAGAVASARRTLATETAGLGQLAAALDGPLGAALEAVVATIRAARGRVVVTGIGKSGHIGTKIAATLASTGTPAFFVHPSEASHGDLGMVTADDVLFALSWSGETQELAAIIAYSRRFRVPLVALTSGAESALARAADHVLILPKVTEACPHGLAPTTSTLLQLAVGDAVAVALLEARGFSPEDFSVFHPGGKLGASLKLARDLMHAGERLPIAPAGTTMSEAIVAMSAKGFGCLGIVEDGRLVGIVTDGDLRRHLAPDLLTRRVEDIMTRAPKTIRPETLVARVLDLLNSSSITAVFVVDEDTRPVGLVHMHDLLRAGVA